MNSNSAKSSDINDVKSTIFNVKSALRALIYAETISRYFEMKLPQMDWLKIFCLIMLINREGKMTIGDLGKRLLRAKNSMTQLINEMIDRRLVIRYRSQKDRRNVWIKITNEGLLYMRQNIRDIQKIDRELSSYLDSKKLKILVNLSGEFRRQMLDNLNSKSTVPVKTGKQLKKSRNYITK